MSRVALSLILLLAATARGDWRRYIGPDADRFDLPPAHRLDYFRTHPCDRPKESFQFCDSKSSRNRKPPDTQLRILGKAGPWSVHEISYTYPDDVDETLTHRMLSVLVETGTENFHEILNIESFSVPEKIYPAELFIDGQTTVVTANFDDGGMYHIVHKQFFTILKTGVARLDFAPVWAAVAATLPAGFEAYQPTTRYDFVKHVFRVSTERSNVMGGYKVRCCDGDVEVPFQIVGTNVVPGKAKWFPEPPKQN
jgi:hypothetical protein